MGSLEVKFNMAFYRQQSSLVEQIDMLLHGMNKYGINHSKQRAWYFHCLLIIVPRWVLIDLMQLTSSPHVTKHKTDGGWKSGYYAIILSGQNDHSLWSLSTAEQFVSSFLTSAESDFTFTPRMHKVSTGPNAHRSE